MFLYLLLLIQAVLGLLLFSGVMKKALLTLLDIWSTQFGPPLFRRTMSKNRIEYLINCLRFDDKLTREVRKQTDKFAAVREIWEIFESCCRQNYTPSEYVIINETLLGLKGRCPF